MTDISFKKRYIAISIGLAIFVGCIATFSVLIYLEHRRVVQNYGDAYATVTGYNVAGEECEDCTMVCGGGALWPAACTPACTSYPYTAYVNIRYSVGNDTYLSSTPGVCERYEEEAFDFLKREYPMNQPLPIYYLRSNPSTWYTSISFKYVGYIIGLVFCFVIVLILAVILLHTWRYQRYQARQEYEGIPVA